MLQLQEIKMAKGLPVDFEVKPQPLLLKDCKEELTVEKDDTQIVETLKTVNDNNIPKTGSKNNAEFSKKSAEIDRNTARQGLSQTSVRQSTDSSHDVVVPEIPQQSSGSDQCKQTSPRRTRDSGHSHVQQEGHYSNKTVTQISPNHKPRKESISLHSKAKQTESKKTFSSHVNTVTHTVTTASSVTCPSYGIPRSEYLDSFNSGTYMSTASDYATHSTPYTVKNKSLRNISDDSVSQKCHLLPHNPSQTIPSIWQNSNLPPPLSSLPRSHSLSSPPISQHPMQISPESYIHDSKHINIPTPSGSGTHTLLRNRPLDFGPSEQYNEIKPRQVPIPTPVNLPFPTPINLDFPKSLPVSFPISGPVSAPSVMSLQPHPSPGYDPLSRSLLQSTSKQPLIPGKDFVKSSSGYSSYDNTAPALQNISPRGYSVPEMQQSSHNVGRREHYQNVGSKFPVPDDSNIQVGQEPFINPVNWNREQEVKTLEKVEIPSYGIYDTGETEKKYPDDTKKHEEGFSNTGRFHEEQTKKVDPHLERKETKDKLKMTKVIETDLNPCNIVSIIQAASKELTPITQRVSLFLLLSNTKNMLMKEMD